MKRALQKKAVGNVPMAKVRTSGAESVFIDNRPSSSVQRVMRNTIENGAPMTAQRKKMAVIHGKPVQREAESDPLQMTSAAALRMADDEDVLQERLAGVATGAVQEKDVPNENGMPENLKAGIESLSGLDLSNVRVHANSEKPAQLNALAYAQGNDIHLGPGQEQHLPHEAWHVVQQRQGRVQPTMQAKGTAINDDAGLEQEADVMGARAIQMHTAQRGEVGPQASPTQMVRIMQLYAGVAQLGRNHAGGNPRGRGGKGGYHANKGGKKNIHKGGKPAEEMLRRKNIGLHDQKMKARAQAPVFNFDPGPVHGQHANNAQHADDHDIPLNVDLGMDVGPVPVNVREQDREDADDFRIDMPDEDVAEQHAPDGGVRRRGIGRRIRDKAFGGRTFGDGSNLIGAVANTIGDDTPRDVAIASAMVLIGSAGVLASGLKLTIDGASRSAKARTPTARREARYTIAMGGSNMFSGLMGIASGIATLAEQKTAASVWGTASTGAWVITELINIVSQIDIIQALVSEDKSKIDYVKPLLATLASLIKCIGGILYVYSAIMSALDEESGDGPKDAGVSLMIIGAAISTLHGIIKLLGMCIEKCRGSGNNEQGNVIDDLELGHMPP